MIVIVIINMFRFVVGPPPSNLHFIVLCVAQIILSFSLRTAISCLYAQIYVAKNCGTQTDTTLRLKCIGASLPNVPKGLSTIGYTLSLRVRRLAAWSTACIVVSGLCGSAFGLIRRIVHRISQWTCTVVPVRSLVDVLWCESAADSCIAFHHDLMSKRCASLGGYAVLWRLPKPRWQ